MLLNISGSLIRFVFVSIFTLNFIVVKAQSHFTCSNAKLFTGVTFLDTVKMNYNQENYWYTFPADSNSFGLTIHKLTGGCPQPGELFSFSLFRDSCSSLILVNDTILGSGFLSFEWALNGIGISGGDFFLKIRRQMDTTCFGCNTGQLKYLIEFNLGGFIGYRGGGVPAIPSTAYCNNMVANPSFEEMNPAIVDSTFPGVNLGSNQITSWTPITNTPDYFSYLSTTLSNFNASRNFTIPGGLFDVPATLGTFLGSGFGNIDTAYIGIAANWNTGNQISYRERIRGLLNGPLDNGRVYIASFNASLCNASDFSTNTLYLSVLNLGLQVRAKVFPLAPINNPGNWESVSNAFVANGTESLVVIGYEDSLGSFQNHVNLDTIPGWNRLCYYFIDHVSVRRLANAGRDTAVCTMDTIVIGETCYGIRDVNYSWSPGQYLNDSTIASPTLLFVPPGLTEFVVTSTFINQFGDTLMDRDTIVIFGHDTCCQNYAQQIFSGPVNSSSLTAGQLNGTVSYFAEDFIINSNYSVTGAEIVMAAGKRIIINNNAILTLNTDVYVHACDFMWRGIRIFPQGSLRLSREIYIEDADTAIFSINGGNYYAVNGVYFNKNFIDIYCNQLLSTVHSGVLDGNVYFDCQNGLSPFTYADDGLRPPRMKHKSYIAIESLDVMRLNVGGFAQPNYFSNHDYGIAVKNGGLNAFNNSFTRVNDLLIDSAKVNPNFGSAPHGTSIHIFDTQNAQLGAISPHLSIGVPLGNPADLSFPNFYNRGQRAIQLSYLRNVGRIYIRNNQITEMSQFGFEGNDLIDCYGFIDSNRFDNVFWSAIFMFEISHNNFSFFVTGNEITNTVGNGASSGIGLNDINYTGSTTTKPTMKVAWNRITDIQHSIHLSNASHLWVYSNLINCKQTNSGDNGEGIYADNLSNSLIQENLIYAHGRLEWWTGGMILNNTFNNKYQCNGIYNSGVGLYFANNLLAGGNNEQVRNNILSHNWWGLTLNGQNTVIGQQGDPFTNCAYDNEWYGYPTNDPTFSTTYATNQVSFSNSPFYCQTGFPYWPNDNDDDASATPLIFLTNLFQSPLNCSMTAECNLPTDTTITPLLAPLIEALQEIESTEESVSNPASTIWWSKKRLYEQITQNSLAQTIAPLSDFADSVFWQPSGIFAEIEKQINDSLDESGSDLQLFAQEVLNILPNDQREQVWKDVLIIDLNRRVNKNPKLAEDKINDLIAIAVLCPMEYGQAVYKARNLLQLFSGVHLRYKNNCEATPAPEPAARKRKEELNQTDSIGIGFSVSPNPNSGEFNVIMPSNSDSNFDITIFNSLGDIVFLKTKIGTTNLPISLNVSKGFYTLQIEKLNSEIVYRQKIIVH
jgi:hypothetical protein